MKTGIKTTEFWALATGVGAILYNFANVNCNVSPEIIIGLTVTIGSYIFGRSWIKAKRAERGLN